MNKILLKNYQMEKTAPKVATKAPKIDRATKKPKLATVCQADIMRVRKPRARAAEASGRAQAAAGTEMCVSWVASGTTIISVRPSTLQNTRELTPCAFGWLPGIVPPTPASVQSLLSKKKGRDETALKRPCRQLPARSFKRHNA